MRIEDITVEYRDVDLKRQGAIPTSDLAIKFKILRNGVGSWTLKLPAEHRASSYLRSPGSGIIIMHKDDVLLSGPTIKPSSKTTADDPDGIVEFTGVSDDCILWDALAYPDPANASPAQTKAYDIRSGAAETVMRQFVNANIGPGALAARRGKLAQKLILAPDLGRGGPISKSARMPRLGDMLGELATRSGLRFRVVQVGANLVYETSVVADRSREIRLDVENGTLDEQSIEFTPPTVTRMVVAGQGEGAARTIIERTSAASLAAEIQWGRRIEQFKDQRNTNILAELEQAGDETLAEDGFTSLSVKAVPSNDQTMIYNEDWSVGDKLTVVVDGQEPVSVVTEAAFVMDETGVTVGVAIGDVTKFNVATALQAQVADTAQRVADLEKTVEKSDTLVDEVELTAALAGVDAKLSKKNEGYAFNPGGSGTRKYMRIATIDGYSVDSGAHLSFLMSGLGGYGSTNRGTAIVHFVQRGNNIASVRWWMLEEAVDNTALRLYVKQISTFKFELWGYFASFTQNHGLTVLARSNTDPYVSVQLDGATTTAPSGLTESVAKDIGIPERLARTSKSMSNGSWNNVKDTGWYDGSNVSPDPENDSSKWRYVHVQRHSNPNSTAYVSQTMLGFWGSDAGRSWHRTCDNDVWSPWKDTSGLPAGTVVATAASSGLPAGWLWCAGGAYDRVAYANLYAAIGTTYGGSGSNFNVPNLVGRTIVMQNTSDANFNVLGKSGGSATVTLGIPEMPSHKHTLVQTNLYGGGSTRIATGNAPTATVNDTDVGATGGGGAHNNLQPYLTLNYMIKV